MSTTISAHFDGQVIVPDQPLSLAPGEKVRVTIEREQTAPSSQPRRQAGSAKGEVTIVFNAFPDMTDTLMNRDEWDERVALDIDSLDRVPADLVRKPGSGAGQIKIADDFDETPEEFKEYL